MSHDESSAIEALRQTIRWLIGGVAGLLVGAATVGGWVATQEGRIHSLQQADELLQKADEDNKTDRAQMKGRMEAQSEIINSIRQDAALQNRDLQYIRAAVDKIEKVLTK
jgi:hypothetical protein